MLLSVHPWTNSIILTITSVSSSGHSFVGLTSINPTKLINLSYIYVHESKDFKLNVADIDIRKNNKLNMFINLTEYLLMPNIYILQTCKKSWPHRGNIFRMRKEKG
jgi:hypothetical protein